MRTTLTIDDDVLQAVRERAESSGKPLGKVMSDLARKSLTSQEESPRYDPYGLGIKFLPKSPEGRIVTMELVNRLRDETA